MTTLTLFITILAWVFLAAAIARISLILFCKQEDPLIRVAEMLGQDPIGDALKRAILIGLVSGAWLAARFLT